MQDKKRYEIRKGILIFISIFILISAINIASAVRLPIVGGDTDGWGTILNEFLNVSHNGSGELKSDIVSSSQIVNGTITDTDVSDTTNLTLGEKITFTFGGIIDNIINGWIKITGGLNVTQNFTVGSSALFVDSSSGNVGIGTTNPERKLDVDGIIRAKNNYVGADTGFRVAGTSVIDSLRNLLNINNATISYNLIVDTNTFVVNSTTHRVGIGTMSPNHTLSVMGDVNLNNTLYVNKTTGYVGIGTTSPSRDLEVLEIQLGSGNVIPDTTAGIYWHSDEKYGIYRQSGTWEDPYPKLMIYWDKGIALMGGNVGIGTTTPTAALHVNGITRLGNYTTKPTCDANAMGGLVFDTTNGRPYVCDGSNWNPMDSKLPKTGQTTSNETGDDGYWEMGATKEYTDNGDGTTTDDNTGLMWCDDGNSACAYNGGLRYWSQALTVCNDLTFATHTDWRLPNVYELFSIALLEPTHGAPYVDTTYFTNIATDRWYITSTIKPDNTNYVLIVYFNQGSIGSSTRWVDADVLCVRGGSS